MLLYVTKKKNLKDSWKRRGIGNPNKSIIPTDWVRNNNKKTHKVLLFIFELQDMVLVQFL